METIETPVAQALLTRVRYLCGRSTPKFNSLKRRCEPVSGPRIEKDVKDEVRRTRKHQRNTGTT